MKQIITVALLLSLFTVSFAQAQYERYAPARPDGSIASSGWSAPMYHPEVGDRIISVNGSSVDDIEEWYSAVKNSSPMIYLTVVDHRTGDTYQLRTRLNSPYADSRLGIYTAETYRRGVVVTGFMPGYPGYRCQLLKSSYDGGYNNGYNNGYLPAACPAYEE